MEFTTSQGGFRSNRSYPSLNHISLAPLTPRFPIDDDDDYYSSPHDHPSAHDDTTPEDYYDAPSSQSKPSSYLASHSVPATPGVLSHSQSRSASRTRHTRSKSSTRSHISDTNLASLSGHQTPKKRSSRAHLPDTSTRPDSEWMLRTGIALASSTREEKGQSWLEKRQSSTSLVSDAKDHDYDYGYDYDSGLHHTRSWSGRRSRSGASTPAALSRGGSRSHLASRRSSRAGLAMTGLDMTHPRPHSRPSRSGMASPADESRGFEPAMVDERIRNEIAMIQQDWEEDGFSLESEDEEAEEIDEAEMHRLTRERGFGFGGWIDRLVEWTLFGVDEYPTTPGALVTPDEPREESREVSNEEAETEEDDNDNGDDALSVDFENDNESTISRDYDVPATIEKPGERGGWEDAHWFLRVMKHALL